MFFGWIIWIESVMNNSGTECWASIKKRSPVIAKAFLLLMVLPSPSDPFPVLLPEIELPDVNLFSPSASSFHLNSFKTSSSCVEERLMPRRMPSSGPESYLHNVSRPENGWIVCGDFAFVFISTQVDSRYSWSNSPGFLQIFDDTPGF